MMLSSRHDVEAGTAASTSPAQKEVSHDHTRTFRAAADRRPGHLAGSPGRVADPGEGAHPRGGADCRGAWPAADGRDRRWRRGRRPGRPERASGSFALLDMTPYGR